MDSQSKARIVIAALALSAGGFLGIVSHEGYSDKAIIPVKGDMPTIGFGTTKGVKLGDTTDPVKALKRAMLDVNQFEGALKQCVKVPLYQTEYDAYTSWMYNVGQTAGCNSTLVKYLNDYRYNDACDQLLRWDKFRGKPLKGLTIRRQNEWRLCKS